MKRPAFQFYPGDWRTDPGLRLCSIGARGLWIEMMCLMHEGEPYGHLTVQGRVLEPQSLARLVSESVPAVRRWLAELGENEVFSTTEDGVVFSRRMVRDEAIREARAAGGNVGAEHGHKGGSHGKKGGRPKKQETPHELNGRGVILPPPSSSSSSPASLTSPDKSGEGAQRANRLPKDFTVPEEWIAWAMADRGWCRGDAAAEAASFVDYWHAKSGRDATKLDWQATWRNWCRNSRRAAQTLQPVVPL
jgi:hypothetical protein